MLKAENWKVLVNCKKSKVKKKIQKQVKSKPEAHTRKERLRRVVPQEYKAQGGSPVKLKPFK